MINKFYLSFLLLLLKEGNLSELALDGRISLEAVRLQLSAAAAAAAATDAAAAAAVLQQVLVLRDPKHPERRHRAVMLLVIVGEHVHPHKSSKNFNREVAESLRHLLVAGDSEVADV
jgi:hypothetical protein